MITSGVSEMSHRKCCLFL